MSKIVEEVTKIVLKMRQKIQIKNQNFDKFPHA